MTAALPPAYQLHLPVFEGPLDVLLRLIERQQLPVSEVSLVMVTEQFLDYLATLDDVRPETVAEFAAVGTRLVMLKARALLPRPSTGPDDAEPHDLVVQLIEYRAVKAAAERFAALDLAGSRAFAPGASAVALPSRSPEVRLAPHRPVSLVRALRRRLATSEPASRIVAVRPLISLRAMVERLSASLNSDGREYQQISRQTCETFEEARAMFLALLLLIRRRQIEVEQEEPFGVISVRTLTTVDPTTVFGSQTEFGE